MRGIRALLDRRWKSGNRRKLHLIKHIRAALAAGNAGKTSRKPRANEKRPARKQGVECDGLERPSYPSMTLRESYSG
jgi:hypothetical protein